MRHFVSRFKKPIAVILVIILVVGSVSIQLMIKNYLDDQGIQLSASIFDAVNIEDNEIPVADGVDLELENE